MKKKMVVLPLDERPCNFEFPTKLFALDGLKLALPEELGDKKKPACADKVMDFLRRECGDADIAVISMDTLLYGGLIPSRLHYLSREAVEKRISVLEEVREKNPGLKIYAFQCIMRCPSYSSSDEEPDYYADCGREIHTLGRQLHKKSLGMAPEGQGEAGEQELRSVIGEDNLRDYTERRRFNLEFNLKTIELVRRGIIDFLIIPQDDSARYGYTAMDQVVVRRKLWQEGLAGKIYVYPGSDEVGLTLMSRAVNELYGRSPAVYVKYAAAKAPFVTPPYEDRPLEETIKYQLMAAGCVRAETSSEADFILALSAPGGDILEAEVQPAENLSYDVERSLPEFVESVKRYIESGKSVAIGDNAYANGGDLQLLELLNSEKLLYRLAGYAGWNTNSNTLGTVIAQAVVYLLRGETQEHLSFLALRYLEDAGYCGMVRKQVTERELPGLGMNYFDVKEEKGEVSRLVAGYLDKFRRERLSSVADTIEIKSVRMPWRRMFEAGIDVSCKG